MEAFWVEGYVLLIMRIWMPSFENNNIAFI